MTDADRLAVALESASEWKRRAEVASAFALDVQRTLESTRRAHADLRAALDLACSQRANLTDYLRDLATRCSRLSQSALDDGIAWIADEIRDVLSEVGAGPGAPNDGVQP